MHFKLNKGLNALLLTAVGALSTQAADVFVPGVLRYEYYGNIGGTAVASLTSDPRYVTNHPDVVLYATAANSRTVLPDDSHESYGARMVGFVVPQVSGNYDFFIKSDDSSQLFLSTDSTTNNLVKIAQENGCCNPFEEVNSGFSQTTTTPIALVAGTKYAIQILLKEGGGSDFVQVAWRNEDVDGTPASSLPPIPGQFLGANVPSAVTPSVSLTTQPQSMTALTGTLAAFEVGYSTTPASIPVVGTPVGLMVTNNLLNFSSFQWYRDGAAVAGATTAKYALFNPLLTDSGAHFSVVLGVAGSTTSITSSVATLTVSDTTGAGPTPGFLTLEYYGGIGNTDVGSLMADPRYAASTPDTVIWLNSFNSTPAFPDGSHDNYGARISGFITPTVSGNYDFFIASDDSSQLYLSTDTNAANLVMIAQEVNCCNPFQEPGVAAQTTFTPIALVAGQSYAIQALQKEGGGGDFVKVAWRITTDPTPAAQLQPIPAAFLSTYTGPGAPITITQQPQSIKVAQNAPATFTVGVSTPGLPVNGLGDVFNPLSVTWFRNGVPIANATGLTYTIPLATLTDSGAQYSARVGIGGSPVTSTAATLTVDNDVTPPTLVSARTDGTLGDITLVFSEPITPATATALTNYQVNNGLTIIVANQINPSTVRLTTSAQVQGTPYTVVINNLRDTAAGAGNVIAANTTVTVYAYTLSTGAIRVDRFFNINGTAVSALQADPRYPTAPDDTIYWSVFGPLSGGDNYGDNYGLRATAWLIPPKDGLYKFFIRSDDSSQLSLSTDETPDNLQLIASETGCCHAWTDAEGTLSSSPVALLAGHRYFVEGLLKEGGGGDYLQVGWNTPDAADLNSVATMGPIPGQYLQTFVDPVASIQITQQPTNQTVAANASATFTVAWTSTNSTVGNVSTVQWQRAPVGSSTFTNIPGATSATYTVAFAAPLDNGAQFRAVVSVLTVASANSAVAVLNVLADSVPPTVVSVAGSDTTVTVTFNEPVDPVTAGNKANYVIDQGVTVVSAAVIPIPGSGVVQLTLSGAHIATTYHITISGVRDLSNNTMAPFTGSFAAFNAFNDFSTSTLPAGEILSGVATVLPTGVLQLTPAIGSQFGALLIPDLVNGDTVTNFLIRFKLFLGETDGSTPADGFSVSFGSDLPDNGGGAEEGDGSGIRFTFDTYDNGGGEAPAIGSKWAGFEFITTNVPIATLVNTRWVNVALRLTDDGAIDLIHDGVPYFTHVLIDGYSPIAGGRFLFQARTGGSYESALIDDISIIVNGNVTLPPNPGRLSVSAISGNNLTISWTGAGTLQSSSAVSGPYTDVSGVTGTSYQVNITATPGKFYRLRY